MKKLHAFGISAVLIAPLAAFADDAVTTFDGGVAMGWTGPNDGSSTTVEPTGGNPDWNMHTFIFDFGITFRNSTPNSGFVDDLTQYDSVTISIDVKVDQLDWAGTPTPRPFLVDFRSTDDAVGGYPWSSVWFKFDLISAEKYGEWTTLSITIDNPSSTELPAGWGGYGDEDPDTFEPMLPDGVTFAQILSGYDQMAFTTLEPGFGFIMSQFDVRIDNIRLTGETTTECPGDLDGSGTVDAADLAVLLGAWGPNPGHPADLDGNRTVDAADLAALLGGWGGC